jgi:NADH:ubiquinone oxidoreductase subunit B-like Fe-S oxidoreductase
VLNKNNITTHETLTNNQHIPEEDEHKPAALIPPFSRAAAKAFSNGTRSSIWPCAFTMACWYASSIEVFCEI